MLEELEGFDETLAALDFLDDEDLAAVIAIADALAADGALLGATFDDSTASEFVTLPEGAEVALINAGASYQPAAPGTVIALAETTDPVTFEADGGDGDSIVFLGNGASADLVRVADGGSDDAGTALLFGGGGEDLLEGGGGDDTIDGGDGADIVIGGAGDDAIRAAGGDLIEGGDGFDTAFYEGLRETTTIARDDSTVTVTLEGGAFDSLETVELIEFGDGERLFVAADEAEAELARLYELLLDRSGEDAGLAYWSGIAAQGLSTAEIAGFFLTSEEFAARGIDPADNEAFVEGLFADGFDRAADDAGLGFWTDLLDQDQVSRADVAAAFAASPEADEAIASVLAPDADALL